MVQALLMALLALLNGIQGPLHWYMFREPVMAGFWVGLIYGDPVQGTIIGATINVSYLGWISAGGANASDLYWAGLLGTFVAIKGGMSLDTAVAFAVPIGLLGNYVHVAYMTLASVWPTRMDQLAAKGDWKGIRRLQLMGGPALVLVLRALPVFLIALFGGDLIQIFIDALPVWAMNGLAAVGKLLPALGMSMLLKFMFKKELLPFFALGFVIAAYTGMTDLLMFACVGVCLAAILIKMGFCGEEKGVV
ncbi:MAG: PTS sugar transporter subunit IIC [Eubacteriales bacterium]|nr:PTS sugar transporter subunit IIC [Eubacteriales bacterium]